MVINALGLVAAATAFLSIWVGHVAVRKVEAEASKLWIPMAISFTLGLAMEIIAGSVANRALSMVCGIIGINALWSVFELKRQAGRVRKGHVPANPNNPRHAALLRQVGSKATKAEAVGPSALGERVSPERAEPIGDGEQA